MRNSHQARAAQSERMKTLWADPAYRAAQSEKMARQWRDDEAFRKAQAESTRERWRAFRRERALRASRYVVPPRQNPPDPRRTVHPRDPGGNHPCLEMLPSPEKDTLPL